MSRFQKSGHWRLSVRGVEHWVQEHAVERKDWSRNDQSQSAPARSGSKAKQDLADYRAGGSAASSLYVPNSKCPICQADVFFYRNNQGSRVYFDDLGPPWPKHPCTDNMLGNELTEAGRGVIQPALRYELDLPFIKN